MKTTTPILVGLGASAALLSQATVATAATFTRSFSEDFFAFDGTTIGSFVDSGTISYTLVAEDLDGDGLLADIDTNEFTSIELVSSGFSNSDFNFSLFFDFPTDDGDDTGLPVAGPVFDFNTEELTIQLADVSFSSQMVIDELGITQFTPTPFLAVQAGDVLIATNEPARPIPEPITILGSLAALGFGAGIKRQRSAAK